MQNPALVIMAAGMGTRFGGPKQIIPVDDIIKNNMLYADSYLEI